MAKGQYYIDSKNILFYDDGSGFKPKGDTGGLVSGKPVNVQLTSYLAGTAVDPKTLKPIAGGKPTTITQAVEAGKGTPQEEKFKLNIQPGSVSSSTLRYPTDPGIIDDESDYVLFSFYRYAPPFGGSNRAPNAAKTSATGPVGYKNYSSSSDKSYSNPSDLESVILYMPEDIQAQFGAGWNGAGFGAAAAGALNVSGALGSGQDILQKVQAGFDAAPGSLKTLAFENIVKQINEKIGANISTNQALGGVTGTILNPNVEMMYEAPKLRTFSLRFKMAPRSQKESLEIRRICNTFKKSMLPSFGGQALFGTTTPGNLIAIPDLCQVTFMHGNKTHPYLPKFKLCGITDVNINYTADGAYAAFEDGAPVSTELTLTFLESKLVFSDEVVVEGGGI